MENTVLLFNIVCSLVYCTSLLPDVVVVVMSRLHLMATQIAGQGKEFRAVTSALTPKARQRFQTDPP